MFYVVVLWFKEKYSDFCNKSKISTEGTYYSNPEENREIHIVFIKAERCLYIYIPFVPVH